MQPIPPRARAELVRRGAAEFRYDEDVELDARLQHPRLVDGRVLHRVHDRRSRVRPHHHHDHELETIDGRDPVRRH